MHIIILYNNFYAYMQMYKTDLMIVVVVAVEIRVLHQVKFVDRIDLLSRYRGISATADMMLVLMVLMMMVVVLSVLVNCPVDGQVQWHGVRADFVGCGNTAVQRYVRTTETIHRMIADIRTYTNSIYKYNILDSRSIFKYFISR